MLGDRRDEFTLVAEPGRFLAADSMTLLTSVIGSAVRGGRQWHYLDDGLYGSYSNVMTEDVHPPILAMREIVDGVSRFEPVTLAGPTCDSADVIARDYPMPALRRRRRGGQPDDGRLHRGDVVAIQRHPRDDIDRKSDFPSARALPATTGHPRCCRWQTMTTERIAEHVKFAYWVPNVSGGLVTSDIEQRTDWGYEYNVKLAQTAENNGFEYALSQVRYEASYGAEYQHESTSFSLALLLATQRLKVIAAVHPGLWQPARAGQARRDRRSSEQRPVRRQRGVGLVQGRVHPPRRAVARAR